MGVTLKVPTIFSAVDGLSPVYDKMTKKSKSFTESLTSVGKGAGIAALAIAAPLGVAVNEAVKFEDKMSDVAKTTGLSGKPLEDYGKSLLKMSGNTRTSIEDLQTIGEIGGQLGVASKDLLGFTDASNKFNVALGSDYGSVDEAVSQVGKVKDLFSDTRDLNIADVITKVGSSFNQLGAIGAGTTKNINDFVLRIGALPDALKPSFKDTAALGTLFEELGIDSQIAAGGFSNFLLVAGKNIGGFAAQMGITVKEAKNLLETDPTEFATKFAGSLDGLAPDKLATKLDDLKIGSQETIKVLGALGVGTKRLTELQGESSKSFAEGTSLLKEYNTKNSNTAANIAKAKNNIQAFAITLGSQLLPIISKVIDEVRPLIQGFTQWASESPNLAIGITYVSIALGSLWAVSKLVTFWTYASSVAMGIMGAVSGAASIKIGANTVALAAYNLVTSIATGLTYAYGVAMAIGTIAVQAFGVAIAILTSPIFLIVAGVAAVIAIIMNWSSICTWFSTQWGTFTSFIGTTWGALTDWFSSFSFKDFFRDIGTAIMDFMLLPLRSVLKLLSYLPGKVGEMATTGLSDLNAMVALDSQNKPALDSPAVANQKATNESIVTKQNTIDMNINDKGGNVSGVKSKGPLNIPIKTSSTTSSKNWGNGN